MPSRPYPSLLSIVIVLIIQIIFYAVPIVILYWLITLNWTMIIVCAIIILLQMVFVREKSEKYGEFIAKWLKIYDFIHI
jgi:uncharacterized membrane protein